MTEAASLAILFSMGFINHAPVAQLDRVTGFEPVGREFESLRACQILQLTTYKTEETPQSLAQVATKSLTNLVSPSFTYEKDGIFYYSRRVPSDLRNPYSKPRIVQSLRTRSQSAAAKVSLILTSRLEEY